MTVCKYRLFRPHHSRLRERAARAEEVVSQTNKSLDSNVKLTLTYSAFEIIWLWNENGAFFRPQNFPARLRYVRVISARCSANIKGVKYLASCASLASVDGQVQSRALQLSVFANAVRGILHSTDGKSGFHLNWNETHKTLFTIWDYFHGFILKICLYNRFLNGHLTSTIGTLSC